MASQPYLAEGVWFMKWKPDPAGPWKKKRLGKETRPYPPSKPPKSPLPEIAKLHQQYADQEERARHGFRVHDGGTDLATYSERYLVALEVKLKPKSLRGYRQSIRMFVAFCAERNIRDVRHVNKAACRDFVEWRAKQVKPNSLHTEKAQIATLLSRAVDDEIIPSSPFRKLVMPVKLEEPPPTFWTPDEISRIVAQLKQPYRDMALFVANTGLRITSCCLASWSWVDWAGDMLTVPNDSAKGEKGYTVPLGPVAQAILKRRMESYDSHERIFAPRMGKGSRVAYMTFFRNLKAAILAAGVPEGSPHDLRHTFARHLADVAPITVVQTALGHRSLKHTQRYTKLSAEQAKPHMEGFSIGRQPEELGDDVRRQRETE